MKFRRVNDEYGIRKMSGGNFLVVVDVSDDDNGERTARLGKRSAEKYLSRKYDSVEGKLNGNDDDDNDDDLNIETMEITTSEIRRTVKARWPPKQNDRKMCSADAPNNKRGPGLETHPEQRVGKKLRSAADMKVEAEDEVGVEGADAPSVISHIEADVASLSALAIVADVQVGNVSASSVVSNITISSAQAIATDDGIEKVGAPFVHIDVANLSALVVVTKVEVEKVSTPSVVADIKVDIATSSALVTGANVEVEFENSSAPSIVADSKVEAATSSALVIAANIEVEKATAPSVVPLREADVASFSALAVDVKVKVEKASAPSVVPFQEANVATLSAMAIVDAKPESNKCAHDVLAANASSPSSELTRERVRRRKAQSYIFMDTAEAYSPMTPSTDSTREKRKKEMKEAALKYKSEKGFKLMNGLLRDPTNDKQNEKKREITFKWNSRLADAMTSDENLLDLKKYYATEQDCNPNYQFVVNNSPDLYRGVKKPHGMFVNPKVGDYYTEKGFLSTSMTENVANEFARTDKGTGVFFTIKQSSKSPKGRILCSGLIDTKGFPLRLENEVLFPPGSTFLVEETIKPDHGKWSMEVVLKEVDTNGA